MKPDISIIPVGGRWSYIVVIEKESNIVTIEGKSTYIDERSALRYARTVATRHL